MENSALLNPKIIGLFALALVIGIVGGYLYTSNNLQPEITDLRQSNNELQANLSAVKNELIDTKNILAARENQLSSAQDEIESLHEDLDLYESDVTMLMEEVDRITESYLQIESDYNELSVIYDELALQSQYRLAKIFLGGDLTLSYNYPTRIYTSQDFTVEGETTRFDYSFWCEQGSGDTSTQLRIYKAGTPVRVYSHTVKLKEDPDLGVYYASGSFSIVLAEGDYYLQLIIDNGYSLSPAPAYQSNIHIWEYL